MLDLDVDMGVGLDKLGQKQRLHSRLKMIECSDPHGNTPLSEAAGGGHPEAITLLVENGADINTKASPHTE